MGYDTFAGALIYHTSASTKKGIEGLKVYYLTRDEIDKYYADFRDNFHKGLEDLVNSIKAKRYDL